TRGASFNHLVGAGKQCGRNGQAERFGCLRVDDQQKLGRKLDRQVGGLGAFQNFCDEVGRPVVILGILDSVADEPPGLNVRVLTANFGNRMVVAKSAMRRRSLTNMLSRRTIASRTPPARKELKAGSRSPFDRASAAITSTLLAAAAVSISCR